MYEQVDKNTRLYVPRAPERAAHSNVPCCCSWILVLRSWSCAASCHADMGVSDTSSEGLEWLWAGAADEALRRIYKSLNN